MAKWFIKIILKPFIFDNCLSYLVCMGIVEQRTVSRLIKGAVSEVYSYAFFHNAVSRLFLIFGISSSFKEQSVKKQPFVNIDGRGVS